MRAPRKPERKRCLLDENLDIPCWMAWLFVAVLLVALVMGGGTAVVHA